MPGGLTRWQALIEVDHCTFNSGFLDPVLLKGRGFRRLSAATRSSHWARERIEAMQYSSSAVLIPGPRLKDSVELKNQYVVFCRIK